MDSDVLQEIQHIIVKIHILSGMGTNAHAFQDTGH